MRIWHILIAYFLIFSTGLLRILTPSWIFTSTFPYTKWPAYYLWYIRVRVWLLQISARVHPSVRDYIVRRDLRKTIRAASKISWWKGRLNADSPLSTIQVITKQDLLDVPYEALMGTDPRVINRMSWRRTSGTTGQPFQWGMDGAMILRELNIHHYRPNEYFGAKLGTLEHPGTIAINTPGISEVQPFGMLRISVSFKENSSNPLKEKESLQKVLEEMVRADEKHTFFSYPTELVALARTLERNNLSITSPYIIATGQVLDPEVRGYLAKTFGSKVYGVYITRELGIIGFECRVHEDTYHMCDERAYIETLDAKGSPVAKGEVGKIVVTTLDQMAMPLIRYSIGDDGHLIPGDTHCECGLTLTRLRFSGRATHYVELPNGKRISTKRVRSTLLENPFFQEISRARVTQDGRASILVEIEARNEARLSPETHESLLLRLRTVLEHACVIRITYTTFEHKVGKFKDFVSLSQYEESLKTISSTQGRPNNP